MLIKRLDSVFYKVTAQNGSIDHSAALCDGILAHLHRSITPDPGFHHLLTGSVADIVQGLPVGATLALEDKDVVYVAHTQAPKPPVIDVFGSFPIPHDGSDPVRVRENAAHIAKSGKPGAVTIGKVYIQYAYLLETLEDTKAKLKQAHDATSDYSLLLAKERDERAQDRAMHKIQQDLMHSYRQNLEELKALQTLKPTKTYQYVIWPARESLDVRRILASMAPVCETDKVRELLAEYAQLIDDTKTFSTTAAR